VELQGRCQLLRRGRRAEAGLYGDAGERGAREFQHRAGIQLDRGRLRLISPGGSIEVLSLGGIVDAVGGRYRMQANDVKWDFWCWLGKHGPDPVANLVGHWLYDLDRRRCRAQAKDDAI
jgi:hypothetical protein